MAKKLNEKPVSLSENDKSRLILFWEGEDVLYKTDHPEYMNSNKREAALKRITEEMRNIGVEITHIQLKKIMQNLRTTYNDSYDVIVLIHRELLSY